MSNLIICIFTLVFSTSSFAFGNVGVFPPMVKEGHETIDYRVAVDPAPEIDTTRIVQRLHYQAAINSDFMWHLIAQSRRADDLDLDFDYVQAQFIWDLGQDNQKFRTGLRFDVRLRDDEQANALGFNWMSQYNFDKDWHARAVLMTGVQVGNNAVDGVVVQTRWQLAKRLGAGQTIGIDMYNVYGNTRDFGDFDDQRHSIGPIFITPIGSGWSIFSSALFGLSDSAPDNQLKLWIRKKI